MSKDKKLFSNMVCAMALHTATDSVNGKCLMILHQPKVPSKLKDKYQE